MEVCKKGLAVKPYKSFAGWYIGTWDADGPRCRLTTMYAKTEEEAKQLPLDRCDACENVYCNGCGYCEIVEA